MFHNICYYLVRGDKLLIELIPVLAIKMNFISEVNFLNPFLHRLPSPSNTVLNNQEIRRLSIFVLSDIFPQIIRGSLINNNDRITAMIIFI